MHVLELMAQGRFARKDYAQKIGILRGVRVDENNQRSPEAAIPLQVSLTYMLGDPSQVEWMNAQQQSFSATPAANWDLQRFQQALEQRKIRPHSFDRNPARVTVFLCGEVDFDYYWLGAAPDSGVASETALYVEDGKSILLRRTVKDKGASHVETVPFGSEELQAMRRKSMELIQSIWCVPPPSKAPQIKDRAQQLWTRQNNMVAAMQPRQVTTWDLQREFVKSYNGPL